jgi:protein O-mannosyl-transferase
MAKPNRKAKGPENPRPSRQEAPKPAQAARDLWIYLVLFFTIFVAYSQVREFDFVHYDDQEIVDNPLVNHGLSPQGLVHAFTSDELANWIPVTQLSHMLDFQVFGMRSGWHHLGNVLFHAIAALLLFAFLHRATGARWRSALVAFLFALHPLHVESVAWFSERKDVLSALFCFLTLLTYVRYTERPERGRYLVVLVCFALDLMSKSMMVTLPFVLLLLDVWPLRRVAMGLTDGVGKPRTGTIPWQKAVWEKIPFFALSFGAALATYLVQKSHGAVEELAEHPLAMRVENSLISYAVYIVKMFWPTKLALLYPYPSYIPAWQALVATLAVAGVSVLVLRSFRTYPYLALGWLWYLGTLVPVIGLVQVGIQSHADRYTYIPMVGLFVMVAWGAADIVQRWPGARWGVIGCLAGACLACVPITMSQTQYWKNSESLFSRAVNVTEDNYAMQDNLGITLAKIPGRLPEAIPHYEEAVRIKPDFAGAHVDLGAALAQVPGRLPEAMAHYQTALRIKPDFPDAHVNLGVALSSFPGRLPEAIAQYEEALRIKPDYADAQMDLGVALSQIPGRLPDAISHYEAAVRIKPDFAGARVNLGVLLSNTPGRMSEAIDQFKEALRIDPGSAEAHTNLGFLLAKMPGREQEAISEYEAAIQIKPTLVEAHMDLGDALAKIPGRVPEAIAQYEAALQLRPDPSVQQKLDQLRAGGMVGAK